MAVQFAQPYRFDEQQLARMAEAGIVPSAGTALVDGVPHAGGAPVRFSWDEYQRLGPAGVLDDDERVELSDGEVVRMTPVGHRHTYTVDLLTEFLGEQTRGRAILRVQSPLKLDDGEGPMPDLVLLRMHEDRYRSRQAGPRDALLVVEVADSTLPRYLLKAEQYARAAIPEYWIADVNRSRVIVHRSPAGDGYAEVREYRRGQSFASPALEGRRVDVEAVLGPA